MSEKTNADVKHFYPKTYKGARLSPFTDLTLKQFWQKAASVTEDELVHISCVSSSSDDEETDTVETKIETNLQSNEQKTLSPDVENSKQKPVMEHKEEKTQTAEIRARTEDMTFLPRDFINTPIDSANVLESKMMEAEPQLVVVEVQGEENSNLLLTPNFVYVPVFKPASFKDPVDIVTLEKEIADLISTTCESVVETRTTETTRLCGCQRTLLCSEWVEGQFRSEYCGDCGETTQTMGNHGEEKVAIRVRVPLISKIDLFNCLCSDRMTYMSSDVSTGPVYTFENCILQIATFYSSDVPLSAGVTMEDGFHVNPQELISFHKRLKTQKGLHLEENVSNLKGRVVLFAEWLKQKTALGFQQLRIAHNHEKNVTKSQPQGDLQGVIYPLRYRDKLDQNALALEEMTINSAAVEAKEIIMHFVTTLFYDENGDPARRNINMDVKFKLPRVLTGTGFNFKPIMDNPFEQRYPVGLPVNEEALLVPSPSGLLDMGCTRQDVFSIIRQLTRTPDEKSTRIDITSIDSIFESGSQQQLAWAICTSVMFPGSVDNEVLLEKCNPAGMENTYSTAKNRVASGQTAITLWYEDLERLLLSGRNPNLQNKNGTGVMFFEIETMMALRHVLVRLMSINVSTHEMTINNISPAVAVRYMLLKRNVVALILNKTTRIARYGNYIDTPYSISALQFANFVIAKPTAINAALIVNNPVDSPNSEALTTSSLDLPFVRDIVAKYLYRAALRAQRMSLWFKLVDMIMNYIKTNYPHILITPSLIKYNGDAEILIGNLIDLFAPFMNSTTFVKLIPSKKDIVRFIMEEHPEMPTRYNNMGSLCGVTNDSPVIAFIENIILTVSPAFGYCMNQDHEDAIVKYLKILDKTENGIYNLNRPSFPMSRESKVNQSLPSLTVTLTQDEIITTSGAWIRGGEQKEEKYQEPTVSSTNPLVPPVFLTEREEVRRYNRDPAPTTQCFSHLKGPAASTLSEGLTRGTARFQLIKHLQANFCVTLPFVPTKFDILPGSADPYPRPIKRVFDIHKTPEGVFYASGPYDFQVVGSISSKHFFTGTVPFIKTQHFFTDDVSQIPWRMRYSYCQDNPEYQSHQDFELYPTLDDSPGMTKHVFPRGQIAPADMRSVIRSDISLFRNASLGYVRKVTANLTRRRTARRVNANNDRRRR